MTRRRLGLVALAAAGLAVLGCSERLTSPADCPALCPGGGIAQFDTVLTAMPHLDSSFTGYVDRGATGVMLASDSFSAGDNRAVVRFLPRDTTVLIGGQLVTYTVDSVAINLGLIARDTLLPGLKLVMHRLPRTVDTTTTFDQVEAWRVDSTLVDTFTVADTVRSGRTVRLLIKGDKVPRMAIASADSGVLALAISTVGSQHTGVRLSGVTGFLAPSFVTYARANVQDTLTQRQTITRTADIGTWVTRPATVTPPAGALVVGGTPSSRALLRFQLPARLRDTATIVRATLELVPALPFAGIASDPSAISVRGVRADVGAKSPIFTAPVQQARITPGSADTVKVEVAPIVANWRGANPLPPTLQVFLSPEASSFTVGYFLSSRSPTPSPARLRITYLMPFPFERP
ncbi:MAG: hypothetical protein ACOY71_05905 [Gemmatimonadota bacterium]